MTWAATGSDGDDVPGLPVPPQGQTTTTTTGKPQGQMATETTEMMMTTWAAIQTNGDEDNDNVPGLPVPPQGLTMMTTTTWEATRSAGNRDDGDNDNDLGSHTGRWQRRR